MKDPWNPSCDEIVAWAFDEKSACPDQDWELAVTELGHAPLLISLASDATCPKRQFFLRCLYLLVGDAVRTVGATHNLAAVRQLVEKAKLSEPESIRRWADQALELMANPSSFNYDDWCRGRLVG